MSNAVISPIPKFTAIDENGDPYVGAKLYTYESGTTTPKATWKDADKTIQNTNPIILDSKGQADIWIDLSDGEYRFKLTDPNDIVLWTVDHVSAISGDPSGIDDYSTDVTEMQKISDPYPSEAESLATSLAGEIERLRYQIKQIIGKDQWYMDSDTDLSKLIEKEHLQERVLSGCRAYSDFSGDEDHDVTIDPGYVIMISGSDYKVFHLSSTITKQIDAAWAEGDNAGGLPSALSLTADTMYYVFLIGKDDGTVDAGFDTDANAANLLADATDYSWYILLHGNLAVFTNAYSELHRFRTTNDGFVEYTTQYYDVSDSSLSDGIWETSGACIAPPNATVLFAFYAYGSCDTTGSNGLVLYGKCPDTTKQVIVSRLLAYQVSGESMQTAGFALIQVDTNRQIKYMVDGRGNVTPDAIYIYNYGYYLNK